MPEEQHRFALRSTWTGNSNGDGALAGAGGTLDYGPPPAFGGKPGRTNPEELLMGAVASCYSITLAILAERRRLPITRIEMECEGEVVRQVGGTLKFVSIRLSPRLTLTGNDPSQIQAATDAAYKAEQYCVVSNAVRGNVEITVAPEILSE
jgi:peroxiredoxin-like protein